VSANIGIIVFPGSSNHDISHALESITEAKVQSIWHKDTTLPDSDLLVIPGGATFGDYLRTGAIASQSPIMNAVADFTEQGGPVLGICNGFQVLLEANLLPGVMLPNKQMKFTCKQTYLRCETSDTPFTSTISEGQTLQLPVAHGKGNYTTANDEQLKLLQDNNQIVFRYCNAEGKITDEVNFNGSTDHIAGICNKDRNVVGMMPHPDRAVEKLLGSTDGKYIFKSALQMLQTA